MRAHEELVRRLALKRRRKLGSLSDEAFEELEHAVRKDPSHFVDDDQEQAFALVAQALERYEQSRHDDDLLDDTQYAQERERRLQVMRSNCQQALALDDHCLDAMLLSLLAADLDQEELFEQLLKMDASVREVQGDVRVPATGDAWADVFARPRLRVKAALARSCIATARFRMATNICYTLLTRAPLDALGARLTCALALARLEDEDGFNWLDAREGRHGNAWFHLGRVILMYKLGRLPAARRALRGYQQLCEGGSYLLLQPMYVDTYLPDRPAFEAGSFAETLLAVHEADPIVCDVPDFATWACEQPGFLSSAQEYCARNGFEWRNWDE